MPSGVPGGGGITNPASPTVISIPYPATAGTNGSADVSKLLSGPSGRFTHPGQVLTGAQIQANNDSDSALAITFDNSAAIIYIGSGNTDAVEVPYGATTLTWTILYQNSTKNRPNETLALIFFDRTDLEHGYTVYRGPINPNAGGGAALSGILVFDVKTYGALGDGVTDDTAAINRAITAASGAFTPRGIVWFPPGSYLVSSTLTIRTNVVFMGAGMGTDNGAAGISRIIGAQAMGGGPSGKVGDLISTPIPPAQNTNGFTQLNLRIENLQLDCTNMGQSNLNGYAVGFGNAIHLYGCRYSTIRGVNVYNAPNWSMLVEGDGSNFSYNNWIDHNRIETNAGGGIRLASGTEANWVDHNDFNECGAACASAQPVFGTTSTQTNHLWLTAGYCWVLDNLFENNGSYTTPAVQVDNSGPVRIIGNRFDHVRNQAIQTNAPNTIITGNQIGRAGTANPGTLPAIDIAGGATGGRALIVGNTIHQDGVANTYTFCVREAGPAGFASTVADNWLETGSAGFVSFAASSLSKAHHNVGLNPVGNFGPPAVPASGTALINPAGVDVMIVIDTVGTLTDILIGGTSLGVVPITAMTIRLPAGQTITLTYAGAAPTWKWFGD